MRSLAVLLFLVCACGRQASSPKPGAEGASASGSGAAAIPAGGPSSSADSHDAAPAPCDPGECGPPMRMPNHRCPDGSIGGPTGQCLRKPDGRCAWEVRACP